MIKQEIKSFIMNYSNELSALECAIPCSMYSTLANHGIIANPYEEKNAMDFADCSEHGVSFISRFRVDESILLKANIDLRISMLDTVAKITLNGQRIAEVSNFHLTHNFNVKNMLVKGENTLEVEILPPSPKNCRKPRYMYGTQFSPRLLDMGIYGEVALVAYDQGYIESIRLQQEHSDDAVKLSIELDTVGNTKGKYAVATLESPGGKVYFGAFHNGKSVINVTSPNLWWPAGMGSQSLYRLSVNLYSDSDIIDTKEIKVGLRALSIDNGEKEENVSINGTPYFSKGVTFVPTDSIVPYADKQRVRKILESVADANCNTVRVSALGYYMPDYFYDYCDELGLMVWQDVMVLSNITDGVNSEEIEREIKENISRLSYHACFARVVGAVDVERACLPHSELDNHSFIELYESYYDDTVRCLVEGMDVQYSIALPKTVRDGYCSNTSLCDVADSMALVSIPDVKTLREISKSDNINLLSPVMEAHQLARTDNLSFIVHSFNKYLYPTTLDTLVYVTQQSAAEEIKNLIEKARISNNKRALFMSQANDTWYGISQSVVDYFGRWKASSYMLKREFSPILAIAEQIDNDIVFYVSNDTDSAIDATLRYSVIDNRNVPVLTDNMPIKVGAFATVEVLRKDLSKTFLKYEDECYLSFEVVENSNVLSKSTLLFTKCGEKTAVNQKSFKLLKPSIECNITGTGCEYTLTYKADVYVKNLEFSFKDTDCIFEDNFFDVTDTYSHRLRFKTAKSTTMAKLSRELKIQSAYDVGR